MNKTKVPWADYSWNPITGCTKYSPGCDNCYAHALAKRFNNGNFPVMFHPKRISQPLKVKKPSRIFVCSMSDLFHPDVPEPAQWAIWNVFKARSQHTFIVLTKRAGNMADLLSTTNHFGFGVLPNVWLGVSAENFLVLVPRIISLTTIPAPVRFISAEPLLEDLGSLHGMMNANQIDWVIAGPETGPGARPCKDEWIENLSKQSPCFFDKRKNWTRREFPK